MKIDPYYQRQKCKRYYNVYADIRGGSMGRCVKRQWGCRQRQFSAFSMAISSETLEMRPALLYSDMQSVVSCSMIPNCMTLNGYFALSLVFAPVWLAPTVRLSKNNCVKINKGRHTLSAAQIFGETLVSGNIKLMPVFAGVLRRHPTTVGSRAMRTCCGRMLTFIRCVHA